MPDLVEIVNDPRDYAWGVPGGISAALGWPASDEPQAELWLGAHPSGPSRAVDPAPWRDLHQWEQQSGTRLPYLLKVLCAGKPLSLQAHPTPAQAQQGFDRENAAGVPLNAAQRNYKDPFAKPELILAVRDGFQALCGFRALPQTLAVIEDLLTAHDSLALRRFRDRLAEGTAPATTLRDTFTWLLDGGTEIAELMTALHTLGTEQPQRFPLLARLVSEFSGDPGVAAALLLNHLTLSAGQALWLPAGNIHAYLSGLGMELMGPSDNVLRGGMTPKHVDTAELQRVLDFNPSPAPYLEPVLVGSNIVSYRPSTLASGAEVPFELFLITGAADVITSSPAIATCLDGDFSLTTSGVTHTVPRGHSVFISAPARLRVAGAGQLYLANSR